MPTAVRAENVARRLPRRLWTMLAIAAVIGVSVRVYEFPHLPAGLNPDEISSAYESYSLLKTGADRWGNSMPLYFLSWGSGQNVLQSYLQVPAVAAFGLSPLGARLVPLLIGLATLPVFFFALLVVEGSEAACAGTLMLAVCPWHVMLSRWGLESNLMPFLILLGVLTYSAALRSGRTRRIVPCLLPFALALYAYGMAILIVPPLVLLLLCVDWKTIWRDRFPWSIAAASALALGLPIAFFTLKNYATMRNYVWERHLPFTIPLLPETRLSQVTLGNPLRHNYEFLRHGLQDHNIWNQVPGLRPLPWFMLLLAGVGTILVLWRAIREGGLKNPFLLWLLASVPVLMKVTVNINQANTLFLPLLALAAIGYARLTRTIRYRTAAATALCLLCLGAAALFSRSYFGRSYPEETAFIFNPSLPRALDRLETIRTPGMPVYITESIVLNYVQTLFYLRIDPRTYQISGATYAHPEFGSYVFRRNMIVEDGKLFYLLRSEDPPLCAVPTHTERVGAFLIGMCGIER